MVILSSLLQDETGQIHQMWYDDVTSLHYKYEFAVQEKLRGVGMWHVDALNYTLTAEGQKERDQMSGALPH